MKNQNFRRWLFSIVSALSLVAAIYFSFLSKPNDVMTGVWLTFGLFTLVIGWPEFVESISFLGHNIKLREVKNAIHELKQLAEVNSRSILELIQCSNRMMRFSPDKSIDIYNSIQHMLHKLGFEEKEIKDIQANWHKWVEMDYVLCVLQSNINHTEIPKENLEKWYKKREEIKGKMDEIQADELRSIFQEMDGYTEKIQNIIDDFAYYKQHKEHRDFKNWKRLLSDAKNK